MMKNLSENFVRQVLDSSPEATIIVDSIGSIVFSNGQMTALFGYKREELIDQPVEILLPERYQDSHPKNRQSFLKKPRVRPMGQGLKLFGQHRDGTEIPIEISLSPIEMATTETFVCAAIRDVSLHRNVEEQLTGILEKSLNEIYIFSSYNLRFIQVNEGARNNLGYSMDELQNMTPVDIKPEYTEETFNLAVEGLRIGEQENLVFETIHKRKDGSTYPVEIHLQLSLYQNSPVFSAIVLDITERRQTETLLRKSNDLLEQRVVRRTAALEEARYEADRANSEKSRFLAAASHDLRQPLQSLGLYLSVMTRTLSEQKDTNRPDAHGSNTNSSGQPDSQKLIDISCKMRKSLDAMGQLLDALLDISKLDAGSITADKSDFRIGELFERIVTGSVQQAEEKGLEFLSIGEDCVVHTDAALLERLIENFVTNAIRYTETGTITIGCQCSEGVAIISVTDTGIGIPENMTDKIFDEYYQLDNQVRDRRKGLGLGLSIVRHLAKILDHPLRVNSEPGVGSTFAVEVPLGNLPNIKQTPARQEKNKITQLPTVLLVEDDLAILDATTMLLELSNIQVYSASCGSEAMQLIESGVRPDILVSDYRLPGCNGVELVQRVRKGHFASLPVVLVTGDTSVTEIESAGLDNCTILQKPVDTDQLILLIESQCS